MWPQYPYPATFVYAWPPDAHTERGLLNPIATDDDGNRKLANHCFMNAVVQLLWCIPQMRLLVSDIGKAGNPIPEVCRPATT